MKVGGAVIFQNPHNQISDREVYTHDLKIGDMYEPLGFDSIWSVEHHFDDYTMCPDVLQFLSYYAGRTKTIELGSMVVVLPWHDPIRVAEQVSVIDHQSNGRMVLGPRSRTGAHRVRRLPREHGRIARALRRIRRNDYRRPRKRATASTTANT